MSRARTALGDLAGAEEARVAVFRGVPYAAPPVGPLRFQPPQPAAGWHGTRDATRHGPIAPQGPSRLRLAMGDFTRPQDEDCLTLTIWTPAADRVRRPVMVWLHGGAWISGAGSLDWYSGARLSGEGDIVVVGVNHRLGALGYLHHPAISEGNLGTQDQLAALRWVHDHIADFGGDPERVTVVGQSAGASTIGRLLSQGDVQGLFQGIVLQSGGFGRPAGDRAGAAARAEQFMRALDIDPDAADAPDRLRAAPAAAMVAAQIAVARAGAAFGDTNPPFGPVLPVTPPAGDWIENLAEAARDLNVLLGTTQDEGHAFFAPDAVPADKTPVATRYAAVTGNPQAMAQAHARRPGATARDMLADLTTETVFRGPTMRLVDALARRGAAVFAYQFDWAPPGSPWKSCHCIELPFSFGNLDAWEGAAMLHGGDPAVMHDLSAAMRRAWTGFVRTGSPAHNGMPPWPAYDATQRRVMRLGATLGAVGDPSGLGINPALGATVRA